MNWFATSFSFALFRSLIAGSFQLAPRWFLRLHPRLSLSARSSHAPLGSFCVCYSLLVRGSFLFVCSSLIFVRPSLVSSCVSVFPAPVARPPHHSYPVASRLSASLLAPSTSSPTAPLHSVLPLRSLSVFLRPFLPARLSLVWHSLSVTRSLPLAHR